MGVKTLKDMSPVQQEAMTKILEGAKALGWAVALEENDATGSDMVRGLLMGEPAYLEQFDVVDD